MSDFIRQIAASVKRFKSPPLITLLILQKNRQRLRLSRGNAGFSTAAAKNNSEQQQR
jgi:hypothetical protein